MWRFVCVADDKFAEGFSCREQTVKLCLSIERGHYEDQRRVPDHAHQTQAETLLQVRRCWVQLYIWLWERLRQPPWPTQRDTSEVPWYVSNLLSKLYSRPLAALQHFLCGPLICFTKIKQTVNISFCKTFLRLKKIYGQYLQ